MTGQPLRAEDLNYWKTSSSGADTWLDKSEALIEKHDGTVTRRALARELGREAILLEFTHTGDTFRLFWPALESRSGNTAAARVQAATMVWHELKARLLRLKVFGARAAFLDFLVLPGQSQPLVQLADPSAVADLPKLLEAGG